jgi:endonuclease YncB( thermonuclease family)
VPRLLAILLLCPALACAELVGQVVAIGDGDTLKVLVGLALVNVRLADIKAPARRQPYYQHSRAALAEICRGKAATIRNRGVDRYGRTVGYVRCDGVDAAAEQVRRGMAWISTRHAPLGSPLHELERNARAERRGLWADNEAASAMLVADCAKALNDGRRLRRC